MENPDNKPITLEERLIGSFISAIAMACTIAVLSFIFFVITAKGRYAGAQLLFNFIFFKISMFIIAAAAVLGFFLNFDKMVNIFSSLWGTRSAGTDSTNKFVTLIAIAIAACIAYFLIHQ